MALLKRVEKAGDQVIAAIRFVQDLVAELAEAVVSPLARRVPELPLPEALRPPRPRAVAEVVLGFAEKLAQNQKDFTLRLLEAFDPSANRNKSRSVKAA